MHTLHNVLMNEWWKQDALYYKITVHVWWYTFYEFILTQKISDTQNNSYTLPEWLFAGRQDSRPVSLHTSTTCGYRKIWICAWGARSTRYYSKHNWLIYYQMRMGSCQSRYVWHNKGMGAQNDSIKRCMSEYAIMADLVKLSLSGYWRLLKVWPFLSHIL